jgi:phosphoglycolate phosphatase
MSAAAVLLDLDGTLLDTAPDMACAINELRRQQGFEPLPFERLRCRVSHGGAALVRIAFPHLSEGEEFQAVLQRFLMIYREGLVLQTRLFDGMAALLTELESAGVPWGIVTNKAAWLTEPLLESFELLHRAAIVISGDTLPQRKPHPLPLLHAARMISVAPEQCLYIGDAERDVQAARAANMQAIVARFGYIGPDDRVQEWPAHGWIDSPLEILDWIRDDARASS